MEKHWQESVLIVLTGSKGRLETDMLDRDGFGRIIGGIKGEPAIAIVVIPILSLFRRVLELAALLASIRIPNVSESNMNEEWLYRLLSF